MKVLVDLDRVIELVKADDNMGLCVRCGFEQEGCEPDARRYVCEACGQRSVYGAQELLIMMVA